MGALAGAGAAGLPGLHVEFCGCLGRCRCHWPSRATCGVLWLYGQVPVPPAFQGYMWSIVAAWAGAGAAGLPGLHVEFPAARADSSVVRAPDS